MKKKTKDSKALIETWECKNEAYEEVKNLSLEDAISKRLSSSYVTAKKLGFLSDAKKAA